MAEKLKEKAAEWKDLGRRLRVGEEELRKIKEMKKDHRRSMYLLLQKWKDSTSNQRPSTFGALFKALREEGMKPEADSIASHFNAKKRVIVTSLLEE